MYPEELNRMTNTELLDLMERYTVSGGRDLAHPFRTLHDILWERGLEPQERSRFTIIVQAATDQGIF
jgi:hypothetical protein